MHRILLAGLFHEGNSFSRVVTGSDSFAVARGPAVLEKARTAGTGMGGACRLLVHEEVALLPVLTAVAPPGGPVAAGVYRALRDEIVDAARAARPDGIYLDLHGAMLTEDDDDPEGDLLEALRGALGPETPIAVSLDLHAHPTPRMLAKADVIVACKENPHSDYDGAGARAASLLLGILRGTVRPVTAAVWLPLLIGARMETAEGPLRALHDRRRRLEAALLDVSIYNTTTLLDAAGAGQCVTAIADGDVAAAERAAVDLARALWAERDAFEPDFAPLDTVLADVAAGRLGRPAILGDQGDRVLAGTPGDGTAIAAALLSRWPTLRALVPVTDPEIAAEARRLGVGATLTGRVGGRLTRGGDGIDGDWRVAGIGDGRFVQKGPFLAGEPAALGDTALLTRGGLTLLVTSLPGFTQDPEAFRSQGGDPAAFDVVVTKSGHHFKLSFADVGPCRVVDTPGISNYRPGRLPFRKRRPTHPEDAVPDPDIRASTYRRARGGPAPA